MRMERICADIMSDIMTLNKVYGDHFNRFIIYSTELVRCYSDTYIDDNTYDGDDTMFMIADAVLDSMLYNGIDHNMYTLNRIREDHAEFDKYFEATEESMIISLQSVIYTLSLLFVNNKDLLSMECVYYKDGYLYFKEPKW